MIEINFGAKNMQEVKENMLLAYRKNGHFSYNWEQSKEIKKDGVTEDEQILLKYMDKIINPPKLAQYICPMCNVNIEVLSIIVQDGNIKLKCSMGEISQEELIKVSYKKIRGGYEFSINGFEFLQSIYKIYID